MRRPVVFLFLFLCLGIALEYYLTPEPFHFLLSGVIIMAALTLSWIAGKKMIAIACLFLLVTLIGGMFLFAAEQHTDPLERQEGKLIIVEGRILTIRIKDETHFQMLITAGDSGKRLVEGKGAIEDPASYIGKYAEVTGIIELPDGRRNPGLFDYRLYLKTRGVRVILLSDSNRIVRKEDDTSIFLTMTARLKYGFLSKLSQEMEPDAYGLMAGMLFGDCSSISDDVYEAFQKNGIAHILSVSGIHVGIVYLFISRLLGRRKTRTFYLITALILIFYAALSEFSPSVVRSVVMIFIHIFSKVAYRRYDFLSCTAASAIGMLLFNPFYLFNTGFQLSYLAVYCLAAMLPWTERKFAAMEESGKSVLVVEGLRYLSPLLIIQIGMAPLTAYQFNYFSFISLLLNIPVIVISSMVIPLGIILIVLSFPGGIFFGVGSQAAELLINLVLWLNELFYFPGTGYIDIVSPPTALLLIFYGLFFLLFSEFFRILCQRGKKKTVAICCSLVVIASMLMSIPAAANDPGEGIVFVDVGQGDCLHIRTPEGKNILIDGGGSPYYKVGEKTLLPYLLKNGVNSIDLAIATHLHADHYLGLEELAGKMQIKRLGIYDANRVRENQILDGTGMERSELLYLSAGDRIQIEKDVWIDILYPEAGTAEDYNAIHSEEADENRSSLILKLYYRGLTVMMTADVGFEGEEMLMNQYSHDPAILQADILKIGHHGSRYSTGDDFLEMINPEIAVFQVGKNNFGHPHPSVIEKCEEKGIIVYRNDVNGAIVFTYDKNLWNEEPKWHIRVLLRRNTHIKE